VNGCGRASFYSVALLMPSAKMGTGLKSVERTGVRRAMYVEAAEPVIGAAEASSFSRVIDWILEEDNGQLAEQFPDDNS
jgi:hypothetical protein